MRIEPYYCDMHIHTYADANKRTGAGYKSEALLEKIRKCASGYKAMISLTDHNIINKNAYKDVVDKGSSDIILIVGVELHVKSNGTKPYHAHAYFNFPPNDEAALDALNNILDRLYPDKLPSKDDDIPTLPEILNELRHFEFLFLPHGGQSHGTFDNAASKDDFFDDVMMRGVYYNTFDGFTARSNSKVAATERYFEKIGINEFTSLLTGSDNYDPTCYPEPKDASAEEFTPTWVFSAPNFDGLRLALSEKTRLCYSVEPPENPMMVVPSIEHIKLNNDKVNIDVELSPGLNVVIGGSSTGKTMLLETIARKTGALDATEHNTFYDRFDIESADLKRNDQQCPYYISQSYISKVVDKSVDHDTIESIQILRDVFPQDQEASKNLDASFDVVRDFVTKMFSASETVQQAKQALGHLSAPCSLLADDSLSSNPIKIIEPSIELQSRLSWNESVETKATKCLEELAATFRDNPLLPSIDSELNALRRKITIGKELTRLEKRIREILEIEEEEYTSEENKLKQSDITKLENFESVLSNIAKLRNGLSGFSKAKESLLAQEFRDVPKTKTLAGHKLSVVYSFKVSSKDLLKAINELLTVDYKFKSIDEVTAESLADALKSIDGRRSIKTLAEMGSAVSTILERKKVRSFAIETNNGKDWNNLSEGRKTAVLLDLILGFNGNTAALLIDQPEDNLAADYINSGLAKAIKNSKANRQTIIVTHNATIPMLADAQTVVLCRNKNGKLIIRSAPLEGLIDEKRALDWVVQITDGGKSAVQKRFRKYNFNRFGGDR